MKKIEIKDLFADMQNQMKGHLKISRDFINHSGSKGDALENAWINWLREYLPNRYSVDKTIVIDHEGYTSDQIDIVIYDNWYTPFIFIQDNFRYIPAEGVYAVFEVKPDIKGCIRYTGKKIESVRKLKRTTTSMINSGDKRVARSLPPIIGGILASTNSYANEKTIVDNLKEQTKLRSIDIGCIVDYGSFYVNYKGVENSKVENYFDRYLDFYNNQKQYDSIIFSKPELSLTSFFLRLTHYIQQVIGTVPAIDFNAYSTSIDFEI